MPWWGWLLTVAGAFALASFLLRNQLRYLIKVAKALATDERLPRPLRSGLKVALAMKVVPVPDFGIDEVILIVIGLLLVTVYRPTLKAILEESRLPSEESFGQKDSGETPAHKDGDIGDS